MKTYSDATDYLYGLIRLGIRPGLRRIRGTLAALGNPHLFYPTVLVAGTNGKGSTSAAIASILSEAGYRTGLYTSPHLTRFNERIRVAGRDIPDRAVVETATTVRAVSEGRARAYGRPTFFETTTAMAFEHFRRCSVDIAVIEVGMGGRLDATNVAAPLVSVITNIGIDHSAHLGSDIETIAREKAGIIKDGVPVVTGVADAAALAVIEGVSKDKGAGLYVIGRDFGAENVRPQPRLRFDYRGIDRDIRGLTGALPGAHQAGNAATAVATAELLSAAGFPIPVSSVRRGLARMRWPGRLELIGTRPTVLLDSAHNPDGAAVLAVALASYRRRRLIVVLGIMRDKEIEGIVSAITPFADLVIATAPEMPRSADPEALCEIIRSHGVEAIAVPTVRKACAEALARAGTSDMVCVTGSIFTVGEARPYLKKKLGRP